MQEREVVLTKREVEARLVPSGTEIMIPSDTFVTITQSLGGTFTVAVNGNLARIEGHDADAPVSSPWKAALRPRKTAPSTKTRCGKPCATAMTRKSR